MTCTKTNILDNIKTLRTPWRKRHLEKKLFFCFAVFIKPKYDTCVLQIATPTTLKRTYARHRWNVLIMHDFNYFCHVFFVNIKNLVFMQLTMKTRRLFQFHFFFFRCLTSACVVVLFSSYLTHLSIKYPLLAIVTWLKFFSSATAYLILTNYTEMIPRWFPIEQFRLVAQVGRGVGK